MKPFLTIVIVAISIIIASAVSARPIIFPADYKVGVVKAGALIGRDMVPISNNINKRAVVQVAGCNVIWKHNDEFYLIGVKDAGLVFIPKILMDQSYDVNLNFNKTIKDLISKNQVCMVIDFNEIDK